MVKIFVHNQSITVFLKGGTERTIMGDQIVAHETPTGALIVVQRVAEERHEFAWPHGLWEEYEMKGTETVVSHDDGRIR